MSPDSIDKQQWLADLARDRFHPVIISLDTAHKVSGVIGDAGFFGFRPPRLGQPVEDVFDFMLGMGDERNATLEFIESPNGRAMHAYLQSSDDSRRLTLIDATSERNQRQALQQKSNELALGIAFPTLNADGNPISPDPADFQVSPP